MVIRLGKLAKRQQKHMRQAKEKNIGVNAVLNIVNSGFLLLFPLITYPYVLRIIGTGGIGRVSYCASFINYFSLIAMLGVPVYGVARGARYRHDKTKFNNFVNEVFTINLCSTIAAYILLFFLLASGKFQVYEKLLVLQSLSMIFITLSRDWVHTIYENFSFITIRNILTYTVSAVFIFSFVRGAEDYYQYALATVITNGMIFAANVFCLAKYVKTKIVFRADTAKHIKPLLLMFSNALAISIYVNFDITMLGLLKGDATVGLYAAAVKVYITIKSMLSAFYAVAIPRLSFYMGENKLEAYKKLYTDLCGYLSLLLIPAAVGLVCLSKEIITVIGGGEFAGAAGALRILSVSLVFAVYGGLITSVLNVSLGRERDNLSATILGAAINCVLNLIFIPVLSQNGAAVTTLISEFFVAAFCLARVPDKYKYIDFRCIGKAMKNAAAGSLGIVALTVIVKHFIPGRIPRIGLIFTGSIFLYTAVLLVLRDEYLSGCIAMVTKQLKRQGCERK